MATRSRTRAATVREQAQARGLGAPSGQLWVGVLVGGGGNARASVPELGERFASASTHAMQLKVGKPCMRERKWGAIARIVRRARAKW
eukprot:2711966-Pleurochrysis_carterae.AAC.3